jgi:hypothetical protein
MSRPITTQTTTTSVMYTQLLLLLLLPATTLATLTDYSYRTKYKFFYANMLIVLKGYWHKKDKKIAPHLSMQGYS